MGYETAIDTGKPDTGDVVRSVLVVDDSSSQRFTLSRMLRRSGYRVLEARSGREALNACEADPPDFVLSDWMMPEMDGLAFCQEFRRMPRESYGYFILLTSKGEKKDITQGFDAGADDFLTKPVSAAELRARISAGERVLYMENQLAEKNRLVKATLNELQQIHEVIDQDLIQARKIQETLVPERFQRFGGTCVSFLLRPYGHIGGDLVGLFHPGVNRIGFYNIDVSGHGITSALMTARLASYFNDRFPDHNIALEPRFGRFYALRPPEDVVAALNTSLLSGPGIDQYFTMNYGTMDMATGQVNLVQAGHPPPLLQRHDGSVEFLGEGGLPIGLLPDAHWRGLKVTLARGDRLLFYSDGFTECPVGTGVMLGEAGLAEMLRKAGSSEGPDLLDDLFGRLTKYCPADGMEDDVSALLLEYDGPEQPWRRHPSSFCPTH